jgi:hypothetical protein
MGGRYLFATSTGEGHSCLVQECYATIEFTAAREGMRILLVHAASSRMKRGVHSAFILVICHARE